MTHDTRVCVSAGGYCSYYKCPVVTSLAWPDRFLFVVAEKTEKSGLATWDYVVTSKAWIDPAHDHFYFSRRRYLSLSHSSRTCTARSSLNIMVEMGLNQFKKADKGIYSIASYHIQLAYISFSSMSSVVCLILLCLHHLDNSNINRHSRVYDLWG